MRKVINLSYFLSEDTPAYAGEKDTIHIRSIRSIDLGHTSNNLYLEFPNHINTHIDFPRHFNATGKSLNDYEPGFWVFGKVGFICCEIQELLNNISELSEDIELLIVKTGFGALRGTEQYWAEQPVIPASYASSLRARFPKLRVFGFDLISLTSRLDRDEGKKAHLAFLCEKDILVLEDMNLLQLEQTPSEVIIAPLLIDGADGVQCTVFAFQ
jgi:arylformamidase